MDNNTEKIFDKLPEHIRHKINRLPDDIYDSFEEIRIRCGEDTIVIADGKEMTLNDSQYISHEVLEETLNRLLDYSYYAYEEELANGFITIEGGHRVGICGRVSVNNGTVHLIKNISSLNIRRSREVIGASDELMKHIYDSNKHIISNTLIISPPKCGKTTILRDIARNLSVNGHRVGICDERSEIAGCYKGLYSYDLGPRTDVLDGCPKAQGIIMLIRGMSPEVIITDEIGKSEDVVAIKEAICAGVKTITSIHGSNYDEVSNSTISELINDGVFDTLIFLSSKPSTGTISGVMKLRGNREGEEYVKNIF